jgi:hypothetical protein
VYQHIDSWQDLEQIVKAKPLVVPAPPAPSIRLNLSYAIRLPSSRKVKTLNTPISPPPTQADLRATMEIGPSPSPRHIEPEYTPKASLDSPFTSSVALESTSDFLATNGTHDTETPRTSNSTDRALGDGEPKERDAAEMNGEPQSPASTITKRESLPPPPTPEKEEQQLLQSPMKVESTLQDGEEIARS